MSTNLPQTPSNDTADITKLFFDTYGQQPLEFAATDVDAVVSFFEGKGFDKDAAITTGITLLKQAKLENQPVFQIIDTLTGFTSLQLSTLVGEILNNNRPNTSTLGFKVSRQDNGNLSRNILP
jgi:hypothetical protein